MNYLPVALLPFFLNLSIYAGVENNTGRNVVPNETIEELLAPSTPWADSTASHRLGIIVQALDVERFQLPIELDLTLPEELKSKPVRAFCEIKGEKLEGIPVQLDPIENSTKVRLTFVIPRSIPAKSQASVNVYLGLTSKPEDLNDCVFTSSQSDTEKTLENNNIWLLLGSEGGHLYRWEIKQEGSYDITAPGNKDYAGFADLGPERRSEKNNLICLAAGPAMVRFRCTDTNDRIKLITLFAGTSWVEVITTDATEFNNFDNKDIFNSDGSTLGEYLCSDGTKGFVGSFEKRALGQVMVRDVYWSIKFNRNKFALGIVTPEIPVTHLVGPGSQWGGVSVVGRGIDHTITFGGVLDSEPDKTMTRLQQTLNFDAQPHIILYKLQSKK